MKLTASILFFCLSVIFIITAGSCKKTGSLFTNTDNNHSKFFNENNSLSPVIQAVTGFVKRENDKYHFTEKIINQLGYPHWNKAIAFKQTAIQHGAQSNTKRDGNIDDVVFIPFIRENETGVNATLRVTMSATDTSFRFLQDWQYTDTATTGMSSRSLALLLMLLHNNVFNDTLFKINDSSLFELEPGRKMKYVSLNQAGISIEPQAQGLLIAYEYTMTVCYTGWEPLYQGQVVGCPPGPNCPFYRQVTYCESMSWIEWQDDGGGGGGEPNPPSGGGSGGGWNPPGPCGGPSGLTEGRGNEPCNPNDPPGWEPIEDDPTIPPLCDDYIISLQNDANFAAQFASINQSSVFSEGREKGIRVNNRAINSYTSKDGIIGVPAISWTFTMGDKIEGKMHSHYDGYNSIFSMNDIISMADMLINDNVKDTLNYFEGVTSREGGPYIIKISNIVKFRKFAEKMQNAKKRNIFLNNNQNIKYVNNPGKNLKEFMKIIEKELGQAVTIYSGNSNCTQWNRVTTSLMAGSSGDIEVSHIQCQ